MKYCRGFVTNSSSGSYTTYSMFELKNIEISRAKELFSEYITESFGDEDCLDIMEDDKREERYDDNVGDMVEVYIKKEFVDYVEVKKMKVNLLSVDTMSGDCAVANKITFPKILNEYREMLMKSELSLEEDEEEKEYIRDKYYATDYFDKTVILDSKFINWLNKKYDLNVTIDDISGEEFEGFGGYGESMDSVTDEFNDIFKRGLHRALFSALNNTELDLFGTEKNKVYENGKIMRYTICDMESSLKYLVKQIIEKFDGDLIEIKNDERILNTLIENSMSENIIENLKDSNDILVLFIDEFSCMERYTNIVILDNKNNIKENDLEKNIIEFYDVNEFEEYIKIKSELK